MQPLLLLALSFAPLAPAPQIGIEAERLPRPAGAVTCPEPRTPIDAEHTPGDTDSVYRIDRPGSYYLTRNLVGQIGKAGLEIAASDVTVDLMGFALRGKAGTLAGIADDGALENVSIVNGRVTGFGGYGIGLDTVRRARVEHVTISDNGWHGLRVDDDSAVIGCVSSDNGGIGIWTDNLCQVSECQAFDNAGYGIHADYGSTVSRCTASGNAQPGIRVTASGSVLSSIARTNQATGISVGDYVLVRNCHASSNGGIGIYGLSNVRVEDCEVTSNATYGIQVQNRGRLVRNLCSLNGTPGNGAGIHVLGSYGLLEDNQSVDNRYSGYVIEGDRNLLRRNVAGDNVANWALFVGNYASVVDAQSSPAMLGNSGGLAVGPDDPNANYTL